MRILLILEHFPPYIGGAEKLFGLLAKGYADRGHEVKVLTTRFDSKLSAREILDGYEIHRIDCRNRYRFSVEAVRPAIRLARWADVIHSSTYNALIPASLASRKTKTPLLVTVHEVWGRQWFEMPFINPVLKLGYYSFEQLVLKMGADAYVAISKNTEQQLLEFGIEGDKIQVVPNGLAEKREVELWKPVDADNFLFFGRLGISKGLDLILKASRQMKERGVKFSGLLILSRQPRAMLKKVKKAIRLYGLEEVLSIEHELTDEQLKARMLQSACVLVPSRAEGFGFAAVEANRVGVPVVHSGRGALSETVSGKTVLMESYDSQGLITAIQKAWNREWSESELKEFPIDDMITKYLLLLGDMHKKSPS